MHRVNAGSTIVFSLSIFFRESIMGTGDQTNSLLTLPIVSTSLKLQLDILFIIISIATVIIETLKLHFKGMQAGGRKRTMKRNGLRRAYG